MERKISQLKFNYPILNFRHVAQVQMSTWMSFHSSTEMHENREPEDRIVTGVIVVNPFDFVSCAPTGEAQRNSTQHLSAPEMLARLLQ